MAGLIPFDTVSLGSSTISPESFVRGHGVLLRSGDDRIFVGPSGELRLLRAAVLHKAVFQTHGNLLALATSEPLGAEIHISCGATPVASFSGLVSAKYASAENITSFTISGINYE